MSRPERPQDGSPRLAYYIRTYESKYKTQYDMFEAEMSHIRVINEYDPMQLHGVKTEEEMIEMVNRHIDELFEHEQNITLTIDQVALSCDNYDEVIDGVEKDARFVRWQC